MSFVSGNHYKRKLDDDPAINSPAKKLKVSEIVDSAKQILNLGITYEELAQIEEFYTRIKAVLIQLNKNIICRKEQSKLPRSIIYAPTMGLYILLETDFDLPKKPFGLQYRKFTTDSPISDATTTGYSIDTKTKVLLKITDLSVASISEKWPISPPVYSLQLPPGLGLAAKDLTPILEFYKSRRATLLLSDKPLFFRREENKLPRSVVFLPEMGLYIVLKTHGGAPEIGRGGSNIATIAYCIDTGTQAVFRSGAAINVSASEIEANNAVLEAKEDRIVAGKPIYYKGPYRSRIPHPKSSVNRYTCIDKIAFILPYFTKGTLHSWIQKEGQVASLQKKIELAKTLAKSLSAFHKLGWVHLDLKPANIFISENEELRLTDLGHAQKIGRPHSYIGTSGYNAPELFSKNSTVHIATPASDVWSLGCVLAELFQNNDGWVNYMRKEEEIPLVRRNSITSWMFSTAKALFFPKWEDKNHPHSIIASCLTLDPYQRPPVEQLLDQFLKFV